MAGGKNKEWKKLIEKICSKHTEQPTYLLDREDMEDVTEHELQQLKRTDFPITQQQGKASFKDVILHAFSRQPLSRSTIDKHLRYVRFIEFHEVPVDFRNPTYKNFIRYMDYREQTGASYAAFRHELDAMKMILRA